MLYICGINYCTCFVTLYIIDSIRSVTDYGKFKSIIMYCENDVEREN